MPDTHDSAALGELTKHTPGPWRFEWDGDEAVILGCPTWPCKRNGVSGEWQVAVTDDLLCEKPEEAEANARLIAAAPDMLAALCSVEWAGTEDDEAGGYLPACPSCGALQTFGRHFDNCELRAAIAKATGAA